MSLVVTVDLVVVAQYACTLLLAYYCVQFSGIFFEWPVARASVDPALAEAPSGGKTFDLKAHESAGASGKLDTSVVRCWDPCTLADLGAVPATAPAPNAPLPPPRVTRTSERRSGTSAEKGM